MLVGVSAVSIAQTGESLQRSESRAARSAAENVAASPVVRARLATALPHGDSALATVAELLRSLSGASSVLLTQVDGTVLASADPAQVGTTVAFGTPGVPTGQSWTGLAESSGRTVVSAQVPVYDNGTSTSSGVGRIVGVAMVERDYPSLWERWGQSVPNLLTYLGIAGGLGIAGSLLLSRRVKRQTLGLEPRQITDMVEQREAMLHGLKEGLVGLDLDGRVTLINDSAATLLGLSATVVGSRLDERSVDPALVEVLTGQRTGTDVVVVVGDRIVTCNRRLMYNRGRVIGAVTSIRDRTDLDELRRELGVTRATTETLRAQTHEFANQLHVISGLVQLGETDEVVKFIDNVARRRAEMNEDVIAKVLDPALAALLVAKTSLAAEWDVEFSVSDATTLGRVDDDLSADLATVVGNLVDNALEASAAGPAAPDGRRWVVVDLQDHGDEVVVTVSDSGPGVPEAAAARVFDRGFSTKTDPDSEGHGYGLALSGLVCRRRGGSIDVVDGKGEDGAGRADLSAGAAAASGGTGAVFVARLPRVQVVV